MHTSFTSHVSALALFASDEALAAGNAAASLATIAANTVDPIVTAAQISAATVKANADKPAVAAIKRARNIAVPTKAGKTAKPVVAAKPAKPGKAKPEADAVIYTSGSYLGASPAFRPHGGKLSPVVIGRIAGTFTDRDLACLRDLHAAYKLANFARRDSKRGINIDAGALSRLEAHGYVRHVAGNLGDAAATFAITARAVSERLSPKLSAKPAKR